MTANLQTHRVTAKQAAAVMNVSERSVYMAGRLMGSGRADLVEAVEQGRMSLHAALREIDGPKPRDGLRELARAWAAATEEERETFLLALARRAA